MWSTNFYKSFSKIFCCAWTVGCQKFVQYIRMLYLGRFILVESVGNNRIIVGLQFTLNNMLLDKTSLTFVAQWIRPPFAFELDNLSSCKKSLKIRVKSILDRFWFRKRENIAFWQNLQRPSAARILWSKSTKFLKMHNSIFKRCTHLRMKLRDLSCLSISLLLRVLP